MGGNLFKLGRLPRAEYLALEADLRVTLDRKLGRHYRILGLKYGERGLAWVYRRADFPDFEAAMLAMELDEVRRRVLEHPRP